jgi:hypothetical protein
MKAVLTRKYHQGFTEGRLDLFKDSCKLVFTCATIEPPWLNNQKMISCIPEGRYTVERYYSMTFKNSLIITNVPNRSAILFHAGNTAGDSKGCIIVGLQTETPARLKDSRITMNKLLNLLTSTQNFELTILKS